jgi:hypothetical protein
VRDPVAKVSTVQLASDGPLSPARLSTAALSLPPDLRPLARLADDRWQTSPINELYRNVMRRNDALGRARSPDGRDAVHRALLWLYENEDHESPMHGQRDEVLMSLRTLAGGTAELFAALVEIAAGAPQTGRHYRASAVLFALGFELAA